MNKLIFIICLAILLLTSANIYLTLNAQTTGEQSPITNIEQIDNFFVNSQPSQSVTLSVYDVENDSIEIDSAKTGMVIKVHARYPTSKSEGNYIFYLRPESGAYENAMISKGRVHGINKLSGIYTTFYLPKIGQLPGTAKLYAYIPGHGVGIKDLEIIRASSTNN